jgi:Flp pilus assembly protein protease CpaA
MIPINVPDIIMRNIPNSVAIGIVVMMLLLRLFDSQPAKRVPRKRPAFMKIKENTCEVW